MLGRGRASARPSSRVSNFARIRSPRRTKTA